MRFPFHAAAPGDFDSMLQFWAANRTDDEESDVQQWLRACTDGDNHMADPDAFFAAFVETCRSHTSAVFGFAGIYYIVDSHRNDPGTGRKSDDTGCAVVLRVMGLGNLLRYFRHYCRRVKLTMVGN